MARLRRNPKCGDRVVKTHQNGLDAANYGGIQHTCIEHLKQPGGKSLFGFQYSLTANLASMLLYCHGGPPQAPVSPGAEAIQLSALRRHGLLPPSLFELRRTSRGACHRAALRADPLARNDGRKSPTPA
jgi:hypothetical protein